LASSQNYGNARNTIIAVAISLVSLAIIFKFTDASLGWKYLAQADSKFILVALCLHVISWLSWAMRFRFLANLVTCKNNKIELSWSMAIKATMASNFLAAITPSSAGGEPLRMKALINEGMSFGGATAVVLAERLLDGIFFVSALAAFLLVSGFATGFGLEVGLSFLAALVLFLILIMELLMRPEMFAEFIARARGRFGSNRIIDFIDREIWLFREAGLILAREIKTQILAMIGITALIWLSEFLVPSALLMALGQGPSIVLSITSQLIIVIVSLLPLTPGSSGIAELSMSYLYANFVPAEVLWVLIGLWRLITYFLNIAIGAPFAGGSIRFWKRWV
jgi:glycosyltransferase 2 family protein